MRNYSSPAANHAFPAPQKEPSLTKVVCHSSVEEINA